MSVLRVVKEELPTIVGAVVGGSIIAWMLWRPAIGASPQASERPPMEVTAWDSLWAGSHGELVDRSVQRHVVVFTDYQCPYCRRLERAISEWRHEDTKGFAIRYRFLPVSHDLPLGRAAGRLAICADSLGVFADAHSQLLQAVDSSNLKELVAGARTAAPLTRASGRLRDCEKTAWADNVLTSDTRWARTLAVTATPTVVVDGRVLQSGFDSLSIRDALGVD